MTPLYPEIRVSIRTGNRYALVSAIRQALRRAGTDTGEIDRFSQEALSTPDPLRFDDLCRRWVQIERRHPS